MSKSKKQAVHETSLAEKSEEELWKLYKETGDPEIRERLDTAVETFVGPAGSSDDQTLVLLRRCRA